MTEHVPAGFPPAEPAAPIAPPPSVGEPTRRVGPLFLVLFGLLNFGFYLTIMMPALFSLPYKIGMLAPDEKVLVLGLVATAGAAVGLVTGPVAGVLSDRTRSRWGRRRPWLIGGILVVALGSTVVALADGIPVLILGWMIVTFGNSGIGAAITPVVAERVPEDQRGTVGAIVGVATQLAGVLGYTIGGALTSSVLLIFLLPVAVLTVFAVIFMVVVHEPHVELPTTTLAQTFRLMVFNPRRHPDFGLVWVGKLLMQTTLAFLSTYQLYFLLDRLGYTAEEAGPKLALAGGIGIVVTMTFAVVSGILSDRFKRRRAFVIIAALLSATGMTMMAFTDGFGLFLAAVLFILGAAGMFGSIDVAMASDLVPEREQAGRWMSIYNLSTTLATAIAPLLGAFLLSVKSADSTNYTTLFLAAAAITLGTAATTYFVKGVR